MIPIHKGGNRGSPANYRPVSLTSHLIKIFEKIIRKRIVEYMDERKLFNHTQHGFRAGRSSLSQLLAHFDKVLTYLEQGFNVDTIYLDFSKAFDKVDHLILMQKLKKIGIGGKIASWIHSYLFHRKQVVVVNGIKSDSTEVVSGVPQGSVLGPLLFIIMLMDIDKSINSSFLSGFADDTRISREIESLADTFKLQNDLNSVYKWAQQNNAEFNDTKFEHLPYGKNNDLKEVAVYLTGEGRRIATKTQTKDLGVIMQTNCSFSDHIKNVVSVTKDLSAWCLRTFNSRSPELMITLWKQLIVPKLDYCSQLWSPHNSKVDTQEIEMTQRSFIRRIEGMSNYSYWDQLKRLKMYSLERRRERYIITYVWYIVEGLVPNFDGSRRKLTTKWHPRHGRKCIVPIIRRSGYTDIIASTLPVHGVKLFNVMPKKLRNLTGCSKETFKKLLNDILIMIPDEPQIRTYTAFIRAESNSILDMIVHSVGLYELDK